MNRDFALAIERARARGAALAPKFLADPALLTTGRMAARMGIGRAVVEEARRGGRIFAIPIIRSIRRYPDWQLDASGAPLDGLAGIIAILGPDWPSYRFLARADEDGRPNHARLGTAAEHPHLFSW